VIIMHRASANTRCIISWGVPNNRRELTDERIKEWYYIASQVVSCDQSINGSASRVTARNALFSEVLIGVSKVIAEVVDERVILDCEVAINPSHISIECFVEERAAIAEFFL